MGSWCTESEMVSWTYPLQLTLDQFPSETEGSERDMCRFSAIHAHTVRPSFKCNQAVEHCASRYLPAISWQFQDPSQQFPFYLSTGLGPVFITWTALFLSEVTVHCLLNGFLDTHLLLHSWNRGAILLEIESALLSDEDSMALQNYDDVPAWLKEASPPGPQKFGRGAPAHSTTCVAKRDTHNDI